MVFMADMADMSEDNIAVERVASVNRARANAQRAEAIRMGLSVCRNCDETTNLGQGFCDSSCRDDFEQIQHLSRINGRGI